MIRRAWVLAFGLSIACRDPEPPPAADPRAALTEARRALIEPGAPALRHGMDIDEAALREALWRLRAEHGAQVEVAYVASIDALPSRPLPTGPAFAEVVDSMLPDEPALRDAEALNWLFDADVRQTVQRALATHLTLVMVQQLEMSAVEVGQWMMFLRAAEPTLSRCGEAGGAPVLCLDYGADVFVLELHSRDPGYIVRRLRWMQAPGGG